MIQAFAHNIARLLFIIPLGIMPVLTTVVTCHAEDQQTGSIYGQLTNVRGHTIHTGHAVVFLCDAKSGIPLSPETRKVIDLDSGAAIRFDQYWHAVTGDTGGFQFKNVPVGTYRLVAQSWAGISGMPRAFPKSNRNDPGNEPSSLIILHGTAESVVVKANEKTLAYPRQWGEETLRIDTDPAESGNFLLISKYPPLGEGILGPTGWGQKFIAGVVGVTRMEDTQVTLIGLPKEGAIHVSLFNYDNSPGIGGHSFDLKSNQPSTLPIYAAWSNGKYEPPPRLEKLTRFLEENKVDVKQLTGYDPQNGLRKSLAHVWNTASNQVDVPGYGKATVMDLLAAERFARLKKYHRERGQLRSNKPAPAIPADDVPADQK